MNARTTKLFQPIILSGGSGTRLWPASRESYPKQLLPLTGSQSLLQTTACRLDGFHAAASADRTTALSIAAPIIVTNEDHRFIIAEQLRQVGKVASRIILEPEGRNTAPALQLAALTAVAEGEDPILLVMPADQIVTDTPAFLAAMEEGLRHAQKGAIVTFGIVPDHPETGYGYLRTGPLAAGARTARQLIAFIEKPDAKRAAEYIDAGHHLWNAGIFMLRASTWLNAIAALQPEIDAACRAALKAARQDNDFIRIDAAAFHQCPTDSIDYAVMEHLPAQPQLGKVLVVPLSAGWSDVGAWDALWKVSPKDEEGNVQQGNVMLQNTANSLIYSRSRFVAAIGVKDLVIVETPDAVMVADKAHAQDVKHIVARLRQEDKPLVAQHRKVYRPWGWYDSVDEGSRFQVKRIVVNPGSRLSLQMHHHRAEHWIVVRGTAEITRNGETFLLSENQSTYIPLGASHRLGNPGKVPLEIIEVQSGAYLGEDDIVRFEDAYGRTLPDEGQSENSVIEYLRPVAEMKSA